MLKFFAWSSNMIKQSIAVSLTLYAMVTVVTLLAGTFFIINGIGGYQ